MNRQQALEWLVENVTKWPVDPSMIYSEQPYDFWTSCDERNLDDVVLCKRSDIENSDNQITQQEWLDATDTL